MRAWDLFESGFVVPLVLRCRISSSQALGRNGSMGLLSAGPGEHGTERVLAMNFSTPDDV